MYRRSTDNTIAYTAEDLVLFRESPFASWMERLTLENPDHGISPDAASGPVGRGLNPVQPAVVRSVAQGPGVESLAWRDFILGDKSACLKTTWWPHKTDDVAAGESDHLAFVEPRMEEAQRLADTLDAMRRGAAFIVNGQLGVGQLSDSVDLLMRSDGCSELGSYHYTPCDTRPEDGLHAHFRLSFSADLLDQLQGKLPPRMLVIRDNTNLLSLETQHFIYHYRAVKQRFVAAQAAFRKHRMPDPAESASFGRWSDCANAVLRQRAIARQNQAAPVADSDAAPERPAAELSRAAAPLPEVRSGAMTADTPETAGTGCMMSPQRRSLIDMDCPDPRLFTMTKAANLPFSPGSYDTDSVFERFDGRPFDSTLKTGAGGDW